MPTFTPLATDSFARASLGTTNWTLTQAAFGFLIDTTAGDGGAYGQYTEQAVPADHAWAWWSGPAVGLTDNQFVAIKCAQWVGFAANAGMGGAVQVGSGTSRTGYELYVVSLNGAANLYKWVGGTRTLVAGPVTLSLGANDMLYLAILNGTLSAYINNGAAIAGLSYTDPSPLTGGRPGMTAAAGPRAVDWYGGNVAADTTTPTLTSPSGTATGATTATGTVTTDESGGTLYRLASTNATEAAATVKAAALSSSVTAAGAQAVVFTGLSASTPYYAHYVHTDAAGNDSVRVSSASFTTSTGTDSTPPTLTSQVGTGGAGVCSGSVSTDEAGGTLYGVFTASATAPTALQVEAGQDNTGAAALRVVSQAVSATGPQTIASGAITAGTRYAYYMHKDAAGNRSAVAASASFVVAAPVLAGLTSSPLKNNAGTLLAAVSFEAYVSNPTTGAMVVKKTGLTSNGGGILTFTDAALTASTAYRVVWKRADTGAEGLETLTAA